MQRGTAELKQKDFGVTPICLRRLVRVKIDLRLGFDIVGRQSSICQKSVISTPQVTLLPAPASNSLVKSKEVLSPTGRIIG